jgi:hypothetical protein
LLVEFEQLEKNGTPVLAAKLASYKRWASEKIAD